VLIYNNNNKCNIINYQVIFILKSVDYKIIVLVVSNSFAVVDNNKTTLVIDKNKFDVIVDDITYVVVVVVN
jgi:hypothetical protein